MTGKKLFAAVCSLTIICPLLASCAQKNGDSGVTTAQNTSETQPLSSEAYTEFSPPTETTTVLTTAATTATVPATKKPTTKAPTTKITTVKATTSAKPTTTKAKPTTTKAKPTTTKATASTADFEKEVIRLINAERTKAGVSKLEYSSELYSAAQIREKEIVKKFSHTRPDGSDCFSVSELVMGENIAAGQTSPEDVVNVWMNSQGHRENILRERFKITGVGCYYDSGSDTYYWVQLFG